MEENLNKKLEEMERKVTTSGLLTRSLTDWRPILAKECQVYVCGATYIGKRFDEIHYSFLDKDTAKEIIVDNLHAILRYKYFPKSSDETDQRIQEIIKSFVTNLRSTLIKVSFDKFDEDAKFVKYIPNSCVAFRNGVYDFWNDNWLIKYDKIKVEQISNTIYMYDPQYIIMWYFNFDFEPLKEVSLKDMNLEEFFDIIKILDDEFPKEEKLLAFELLYNIAHDDFDKFDRDKFTHLCEILGYTLMQSFVEAFVMLIGSGQNGKNSLFDGCFSNRLIPRPASIDMKTIEEDKFVTGSLVNARHNIFLETEAATQTKSAMIKQLTGSPNQSIQPKGVQAFPGIINCKYIFAGNDQEKIKFSDNTNGFRRRINIFEIHYQYKPNGRKKFEASDYYQTDFHDDLHELTDNIMNTIVYIYFGMFGIKEATKCFENNFKFTSNDWKLSYSDIDYDLKEGLERMTPIHFSRFFKSSVNNKLLIEKCLYEANGTSRDNILDSEALKSMGIHTKEEFMAFLNDDEKLLEYFNEYDIFVDIKLIELVYNQCTKVENNKPDVISTSVIKKIYPDCRIEKIKGKSCVLVGFSKGKLKIR